MEIISVPNIDDMRAELRRAIFERAMTKGLELIREQGIDPIDLAVIIPQPTGSEAQIFGPLQYMAGEWTSRRKISVVVANGTLTIREPLVVGTDIGPYGDDYMPLVIERSYEIPDIERETVLARWSEDRNWVGGKWTLQGVEAGYVSRATDAYKDHVQDRLDQIVLGIGKTFDEVFAVSDHRSTLKTAEQLDAELEERRNTVGTLLGLPPEDVHIVNEPPGVCADPDAL